MGILNQMIWIWMVSQYPGPSGWYRPLSYKKNRYRNKHRAQKMDPVWFLLWGCWTRWSRSGWLVNIRVLRRNRIWIWVDTNRIRPLSYRKIGYRNKHSAKKMDPVWFLLWGCWIRWSVSGYGQTISGSFGKPDPQLCPPNASDDLTGAKKNVSGS